MVVLALLFSIVAAAGGCGGGSPAPRASASPTQSSAPTRAEITSAIWSLIDPQLKSGELGAIETVTVYKVGRDAEGQWTARAYLTPPMTASYWPSKILVVKKPTGWETVSLTVDKTFGGTVPAGSK